MSKKETKSNKSHKLLTLIPIILAIIAAGLFLYQDYAKKNQKVEITGQPIDQTKNLQEGIDDGFNIHVFQPKNGDSVSLPLKILGEARVFENQFVIRVKDNKGNIVKETPVMAEPGEMGDYNLFSVEINYNKPSTSEGSIEIFDYSAKDGSEIDKVVIPVKFSSSYNSLNLQAFFGNSEKNPNSEDCSKVYPVLRRVAYTKDQAEAALNELLMGLNPDEIEKGYTTSINMGVKFNKITIKGGVATVDFDESLQSGVGGSCAVIAIRAQIEQTLKQFPNVSKVEISVNGRTQDILQP